MRLVPIVNRDEFIKQHLHFDKRVKEFSVTKRGRTRVASEVLEDLMHRSALLLRATNANARIAFVEATKDLVLKTARESGTPVHSVTLAPLRFAMSLQDAQLFDWSEVQRWAAEVMVGFDFFGIVDLAVYTNSPDDPYAKRAVWHLHLDIFGANRAAVEKRKDAINEIWTPFLPGGSTAHSRVCASEKGVTRSVYYMMKAPLRTYRVYRVATGKLFEEKWRQKKDSHQPGIAVSVCEILRGVEIDQLCVAGGRCIDFPELLATDARRRLASAPLFEQFGR